VAAYLSRGGGPTDEATAAELLRAAGLTPRAWGNPPGDTYARHEHSYHKVLYCVAGSITFHTDDGDVSCEAGDRLDLDPGTGHAATVGAHGCRCVEGGD
jgi:quercetin dioxygenase-like cupin family protein